MKNVSYTFTKWLCSFLFIIACTFFFFFDIITLSSFSPLAGISIEGESRLLRNLGRSVAWCRAVVWVWQLAVEARPPCVSSVLTALIRESHGGILFHTELRQSLFPLQDKL